MFSLLRFIQIAPPYSCCSGNVLGRTGHTATYAENLRRFFLPPLHARFTIHMKNIFSYCLSPRVSPGSWMYRCCYGRKPMSFLPPAESLFYVFFIAIHLNQIRHKQEFSCLMERVFAYAENPWTFCHLLIPLSCPRGGEQEPFPTL